MSNLLTIFGVIISSFISIWAIFKFVISQNSRLDDNLSKKLMKKIKSGSIFKIELNNEISINKKFPSVYEVFCVIDGCFFLFKNNKYSPRLKVNIVWLKLKSNLSYINFQNEVI